METVRPTEDRTQPNVAATPRNVIDPSRSAPLITPVDPRVIWAAERTALAWIRTGLGLMAFGFVLSRAPVLLASVADVSGGRYLFPPVGLLLISAGVAGGFHGARRYARSVARLTRGDQDSYSATPPMVLAAAVGLVGLAVAVWTLFTVL